MGDRMPIEGVLMAFAGIDIPKKETGKGIPFASFVVKEGEGVVFIRPLPLPVADRLLKEQEVTGGEVLYRVDYLWGGMRRFASGVLTSGEKPETFLKLLESNINSGNVKADLMGIHSYLEAHLALCGLERIALEETAFKGRGEAGTESYRAANRAYYKEALSFVEDGRRCLNAGTSGISLPPFPKRSEFMAKWYREHRGSQ